MSRLDEYLSSAILRLRKNAIRVSLRHPRALLFFLGLRRSLRGAAKKRAASGREGLNIPPFLIASITSQCNLACAGCYARANGGCGGSGPQSLLSTGRWSQLFAEAGQLGVSFILLAGGEPMLRREVVEAAAVHKDLLFPVFTNGTQFDDSALRLFAGHRNLLPVISLEGKAAQTDSRRGRGVYEKVLSAMRSLDHKGIFYGVSVTVTKENLAEVMSDEFIRTLTQSGCSMVFYVEYVPADGKSDALAPGSREREVLAARLGELRRSCRMMFLSFPGDEKATGGCLAAGRGFFHISATGNAEPCPFSPYSDCSLQTLSLKQALNSPLFRELQKDGFLLGEHDGGCLLWQQRQRVESLLHGGGQQTPAG